MSDLIAAIATGSIATAIGIVRVSGDGCFAACDRVFRPRNGVPFAQQTSHKMVFGEMLDDSGAVIDQGLAVRFGGGHSYTGEDSAEFHCHGSPGGPPRPCSPLSLPPEPGRHRPVNSPSGPSSTAKWT